MSITREERDAKIPEVDLRDGYKGICTWSQTNGADLHQSALELLGEATLLKEKLAHKQISTIVIGKNAKQHAATLIKHGADIVYVVDDDRLEHYSTLPFTRAVCDVILTAKPEIMIYPASNKGRDLAPRCAARLQVGLSADCTNLDIGTYINRKKNQRFTYAFKMSRPSFGESKLATIIGPWNYPQSSTVRPGIFIAIPPDDSRTGEIINFTPKWVDSDWAISTVGVDIGGSRVELEKADIIISGGKDLTKDGFAQLQELVEAIRANGQRVELAGSRAAVNAGLIEHDRQIGQTGRTVRPQFYVAVGISGAVQHLLGMQDSKTIIAINHNPNARIFQVANYGIIDEYEHILPFLIAKVKSGYKFPVIHH